jgi:Tfp pilus assembly major pilin PilA
MATFNNMLVTNGGKLIYAKAMSGKTIIFNRVAFGSGNPATQAVAETLTQLRKPEIEGTIEAIDTTTTAGVAIITVQVNNAAIDKAIGIKEIGLFCADPDTAEPVLYAYCFSPNDIDVIPSNVNGAVIWKMRLQLEISNATLAETKQTEVLSNTPVVTAVSADGLTPYVSEISATGKYLVKNEIVTLMYEITGKLSNMESAENGLTSLSISIPRSPKINSTVCAQMRVTTDEGNDILVDVTGEIKAGSYKISIDYFGSTNGNFALLLSATYPI